MANIPLVEDQLGLRVAATYSERGGWADQPAVDKDNINGEEVVNVRTNLLWQPSDELSVNAMALVHRNDMDSYDIGIDDKGNFTQRHLDPSTPSATDDYELFNVTATYDLESIQLLSTTTYLDLDRVQNHLGRQCCGPDPEATGQFLVERVDDTGEVTTQEFRISSLDAERLHWTAGVIYQTAEYKLDWGPAEDNIFGAPGGTLGVDLFPFTIFENTESDSWAVFGEVNYEVSDRLEVGVGARYFEDDRRFQSEPGGDFQEDTFDSTDPKVFARYDITDYANIYVNIAKGFRSGGFNGAGQPPFEPEEVWSYELGSKMSFLDSRLTAEVSIYSSDYDDYQVVGTLPGLEGGNITSNAGTVNVDGLDVQLVWRPSANVELGMSGNYVDAEFTDIKATNSTHVEGDPVDLIPEYGVSLWTDIGFDWTPEHPGFFRVDYNNKGKSHYRNRTFGDNYHSTSEVIGLLDARIGWQSGQWTIEAYGENLLDDRDYSSPFVIERNAPRPWPRTLGIKVGIDFD